MNDFENKTNQHTNAENENSNQKGNAKIQRFSSNKPIKKC